MIIGRNRANFSTFRPIIRIVFHIFVVDKSLLHMFIGRERELNELRSSLRADSSKFIAVYGRRRIGKTMLIREAFGGDFTFHYAGIYKAGKQEQLMNFCFALRAFGYDEAPLPANWFEAFDLLRKFLLTRRARKKVVFLDEVPWMDSPKSDFLPALEHFWNGWASMRKDIVLVICGSATSWIVNKVIHNKGGLHNRLSFAINLMPFTLRECELYAEAASLSMSRIQIVEAYMILGGVPFYWSFLKRGQSLAKNVDEMFFAENAKLKNEFSDLYASLFRNPEPYISVIEVLARKGAGMSREDIIAVTKAGENGKLSKILENLVSCGFVRKYNKIGNRTKCAIYQLIDCYTIFYYKFLKHRGGNDPSFWTLSQGAPKYNAWAGFAFERVCLLHTEQLKSSLSIMGVITNVSSWRSSDGDVQIDLLLDRNDRIINLCEMKFSSVEYTITKSYDEELRNKKARFIEETQTRKAVHTTMVTTYGVKRNAYFNGIQSEVTIDGLFSR